MPGTIDGQRHSVILVLQAVALGVALSTACAPLEQGDNRPTSGWKPLFNGKDLDGWDVYLGPPAEGQLPRGLNNDPQRVFTVTQVDNASAIRVSGQELGALTSRDEYESFHLRLQFKWGPLTWAPRKDIARDSGILYYCIGPHGAGSGGWMKSVESNIMEDDYGSFWSVARTIVDVEIGDSKLDYAEAPGSMYPVYERGARLQTRGPGGGDGVRPSPIVPARQDGWHTAEVIAVGGDSIHRFDDKVTLVLRNARHEVDGQLVALTKGKIQLQSEWAEVYFRAIEIRSIREFPADLGQWVHGPGGDEKEFVSLLEESQRQHWTQCGPGSFEVSDGVATGVGGMGLWWYKHRQYGDFVLRGEFLQEPDSDSGIFLRFPDPGNDPWVAVKQGFELEIGENQPGQGSTGSIYELQAPTWLPLKSPGEWNQYEITGVGRTLDVRLNGHLVTRHIDTTGRPLEGYIGLQNYPYEGKVRHRRLRIKELGKE